MEKILQALTGSAGVVGPPLKASLLGGCGNLIQRIGSNLSAHPSSALVKECLDRSLSIKPDVPEVMNILGDYYYIEKDPDSAIRELSKVLNLNPSRYTRYSANLNLAASWHVKFEAQEAHFHLTEAQRVRDDGLVNFNLSLLQIYRMNGPAEAYKHLKMMDQWFQAEREFADVSRVLAIITSVIREHFQSMSDFFKDFGEAVQLINRYRDPNRICS
jgi:tetratricopeptide (TPR) repeat protein